jgi:hypothetical protein
MPSKVVMEQARPAPSSSDVRYMAEWIKPWQDVEFARVVEDWQK